MSLRYVTANDLKLSLYTQSAVWKKYGWLGKNSADSRISRIIA